MPPKSTRVKTRRAAKENVCDAVAPKTKSVLKNAVPPRKVLADKTNSASDDNVSFTSPKQVNNKRKNSSAITNNCDEAKENQTRRKRKLPGRFVDNQLLTKLTKNAKTIDNIVMTYTNNPVVLLSPLKVPDKQKEKSIADCRPKRICRLPSKFDDHLISPKKYVPVQPFQASTPIALSKVSKNIPGKTNPLKKRVVSKENLRNCKTEQIDKNKSIDSELNGTKGKNESPIKLKLKNPPKIMVSNFNNSGIKQKVNTQADVRTRNKADTNNNAETIQNKSPTQKSPSPNVNKKKDSKSNRLIDKDYSFKVFDDNKKAKKRDASNLDVYEFTFDPTEEPPPQKKKRKRVVRKKQEKTKQVFNNNYDKNVAKSLAALKNVLSTKSVKSKAQTERVIKQKQCVVEEKLNGLISDVQSNVAKPSQKINNNSVNKKNNTVQNTTQNNYNSFHVEDIVVEHESVCNEQNDINYSPVNSPNIRYQEPVNRSTPMGQIKKSNDPLNLQDELSFFDDNPAASSSLNVSTRNPSATPWRVEFGQLPIKWQANTYVKANMTPAFESSFIVNSERKKHVYTNMVAEENEPLPEIEENTSRLKQTSIISFIKEVAERNANKKSKVKSTPVKANTIFEDISNISVNTNVTPEKQVATRSVGKSVTPQKNQSLENITSSTDTSINEKETSKNSNKNTDKDVTYFGFDETAEDQENIVPDIKIDKQRKKALRPRSRAILQELNQKGPHKLPLLANTRGKRNNKENIADGGDKKEAQITEVAVSEKPDNINSDANDLNSIVVPNTTNLSQEDSQSVHLFEDLEVVHTKPPRKSYVKPKRVAFRQNSVSSDSIDSDAVVDQNGSSAEEDDLHDLTFHIPSMEPKKMRKKTKSKKQLSKKEEKEVEAWAAGFNSMCEDIDEYDLVVE